MAFACSAPPAITKGRGPGDTLVKVIRQLVESVNDTLQGHLHLEVHGGQVPDGVAARVLQGLGALASSIWHNETIHAPIA